MTEASGYRGRFAPSPTGPLHLGSLIAAVASYLDARGQGGTWLLRMEDLDPPREPAGAAQAILASLRAHGLAWDEEVLWQSRRHRSYHQALARLQALGLLFRCDCSRTRLGPDGSCAGRCAPRQGRLQEPSSVRVQVPNGTVIHFEDRIQGTQQVALDRERADFVLLRKDGLFAYQLAVVVDDAAQRVSDVVRGSDLLDSTARQIFLQGLLGLPRPRYAHIPVICNDLDQKLSKQTHAPPLAASEAPSNLRRALQFLRQLPPPETLADPAGVLRWSSAHWQPQQLPRALALRASETLRQ